jgi:AcrR family transcriptional regulator
MDEKKLKAAKAMLRSRDMTVAEICKQLGVSKATLFRRFPGGKTAILEMRGELDPEKLLNQQTK